MNPILLGVEQSAAYCFPSISLYFVAAYPPYRGCVALLQPLADGKHTGNKYFDYLAPGKQY